MGRRFSYFAAAIVFLPVVAPVLLPFAGLRSSGAWQALGEVGRLADLAGNTLALGALTLLLTMPVGVVLASLLYRTDLPGRRVFRSAFGVALFVPLPLFALAWQSVGTGWRPWSQGLLPAAAIHALAGLPWVVWLVGLGLSRLPADVEEDGLLHLSPVGVWRRVSLPTAGPAIGLAAVWIVVQAAAEIAITDLMLVRTFAEEVYTQFVIGGPDAHGRAVAVALPGAVFTLIVVGVLSRRWRPELAAAPPTRPARVWTLGRWRWPAFAIVAVFVALYVGWPLIALVRQAGGDFEEARLWIEVVRASNLHGRCLLESLGWSTAAGVLAAGLATFASWRALDSPHIRSGLFALAVALWCLPGPVLGFGIKDAIDLLMRLEDALLPWTRERPLRTLLYDGPVPLPVLWAHVARLFPYAVAILWPAMREVPREWRDAARVAGASAWGEFRHAGWPTCRRAFVVAVVAVAALAMGELAAGKIVQIPGQRTYVQELFSQMHYGSTATTAAIGLLQLLPALVAWAILLPNVSARPLPL